MSSFLVVVALLCVVTGSLSAELNASQPNNEIATQDTPETFTGITPNGLFTWNRYTIIATATATVVVVAGIVASASLLLPLIAYKICYLVGGCSYGLNTYVDQFIAMDAHPRQKRAVEYLGPILQTLAAAYEKYGDDPKKKTETPSFFTR